MPFATLSEDMFFAISGKAGGLGPPYMRDRQLVLAFNLETIRSVMKKYAPREAWVVSNTQTWENLLFILTKAKHEGCDSVAIFDTAAKTTAGPIDEVIDRVKRTVSGLDAGNPESIN